MVIEAGVVAGYVIAWAVGKARRAAGRLDAKVDSTVDAALDKLHEVVMAKLDGHPVLDDLDQESGGAQGRVSELTRQQVELAITAASRKDDTFAQAVTDAVAQLRTAERASGTSVVAGGAARVFTGPAHAEAGDHGIAVGQIGGDFRHGGSREKPDPSKPGPASH